MVSMLQGEELLVYQIQMIMKVEASIPLKVEAT